MEQLTLRYPTDTVHPQPTIPIYAIHSLAQPCCNQSGCWCQANKGKITQLLKAVETGTLTVSEVTAFADDTAL